MNDDVPNHASSGPTKSSNSLAKVRRRSCVAGSMIIDTQSSAVEPERHPGMEVIESLQGFVEENLFLLAPVDQAWQPTDYLPDLTTEDWAHNLSQFRDTAQRVSDDLLVILVGNLVTEEALPNYAVSLEHIAQDPTGTGTATPWRDGCGDGLPKRIGTAICSTRTSGSPAGWTCSRSSGPFII